jgi:cation transport protein ChaC
MADPTRHAARAVHLTPKLVAHVERVEPDPGPDPGTSDHTDAEYDQVIQAILNEYTPDALWVFAYGSLIWNPEFEFVSA